MYVRAQDDERLRSRHVYSRNSAKTTAQNNGTTSEGRLQSRCSLRHPRWRQKSWTHPRFEISIVLKPFHISWCEKVHLRGFSLFTSTLKLRPYGDIIIEIAYLRAYKPSFRATLSYLPLPTEGSSCIERVLQTAVGRLTRCHMRLHIRPEVRQFPITSTADW